MAPRVFTVGYDRTGTIREPRLTIIDDPAPQDRHRLIEARLPVFCLGEIVILDRKGGREVAGRMRKPSKWFVEVEEFRSLKKAIARSHEVNPTFFG
jgi:hypothetical protein